VSAKKHILVPRGFTAADVEPRFHSEKFHRMSSQEARALSSAGRIRELGDSGKIWQLTDESFTHSTRETGKGRVSLEIPFALQSFMQTEMNRRASWCLAV